MRIGYIFGARYDPVALGGNAVDIREDLAGMRALGHDVVFRAFETGQLPVPGPVRSTKSVIPPLAWDTARDGALLRRDRTWRSVLRGDPELAGAEIVFEYWYPDSFAGSTLAREQRLPHVLENLDPLTDERRAGSRSLLARRLIAAERERRRSAAALIVMSRAMGTYLVDEWGVEKSRVHWLPQGVNTELFRPVPLEARAAAAAQLDPQGRRLVGFVGSLASYQRVDVLVDAMRLLRSERDDVHLVLIGGTPERARALGAEDVATLLSHVPYEEIPRLISALDVAVLPDSNWYGSPVKVLEYAAVGVPIVAPRIPPVEDLMSEPGDIRLVAPGDPEALATAIGQTLDAEQDARQRAEAFAETVRGRFSRSTRTAQLLDLMTLLVAHA
jgi:glycosyltransferase involved in cell wall biosynthesis